MAQTPRINPVVRQDFINTNVPKAFSGGTVAGPVKGGTEEQQMAKALMSLIETASPIAAEAHKEYTEKEMERGLARMHRATSEQIERMRIGVKNKIINPNDSPYYAEGVDRGLLRHFGRRFGEQALLDWRKSKAYQSSDPSAFTEWIQNYKDNFYNSNHINGFAPDLINEELAPAINKTSNIIQQRHYEKQVKDYKEESERQFQQENIEVIEESIRNKPVRDLLQKLSLSEVENINTFSKDISEKTTKASELLLSLGKKKNITKNTSEIKQLGPVINSILSTKGIDGTVLYERAKALNKQITGLYDLTVEETGFAPDTERLKQELEMFKLALTNPDNAVNQIVELNRYINEESELRFQQGMDATVVHRSVQSSIADIAVRFRDSNILNMLLPAYEQGNNTQYMRDLHDKTLNQIRIDQETSYRLENELRELNRDNAEQELIFEFVSTIPRNDSGVVDFNQLKNHIVSFKQLALVKNLDVHVRLDNYVTSLENTKGVPPDRFEDTVWGSWDERNPTESFEDIKKRVAEAGVDITKLEKYDFYKTVTDQHKECGQGFFTRLFSNTRRRLALLFASTKSKVTQGEDGRWTIDNPAESARLTEAMSEIQTWWASNGDLQTTKSSDEFTKIVTDHIEKNIIGPYKQEKEELQNKLIEYNDLTRVKSKFKVENIGELILAHKEDQGLVFDSDVKNYWEELGKPEGSLQAFFEKLIEDERNFNKTPEKKKTTKEAFKLKRNTPTSPTLEATNVGPVPQLNVEKLEPSTTSPAQVEEITERGDDFTVDGEYVEPFEEFIKNQPSQDTTEFKNLISESESKGLGNIKVTPEMREDYQEKYETEKPAEPKIKPNEKYQKAFRKDLQ